MRRTVFALIAGYVVIALGTMATHYAIGLAVPDAFPTDQPGRVPPAAVVALILVTGFGEALVGGLVAAILTPGSERRTGLWLGMFLLFMGLISMVALWGKQPLWYAAALPLVAFPGVLLGAELRARMARRAELSGAREPDRGA